MSRLRPLFRPAILLACTGALALAACGKPQDTATSADNAAAPAPTATGALAIANASLRLNPNSAAPSAAYFTLTGGATPDTPTGGGAPDAGRAGKPGSQMEGGMMTMAPLSSIAVPAGGTVEFRQGGKHVMLFDVSAAARTAGKIKLVLTFASGATLDAEAVAAPLGQEAGESGEGPEGMAMEHDGH